MIAGDVRRNDAANVATGMRQFVEFKHNQRCTEALTGIESTTMCGWNAMTIETRTKIKRVQKRTYTSINVHAPAPGTRNNRRRAPESTPLVCASPAPAAATTAIATSPPASAGGAASDGALGASSITSATSAAAAVAAAVASDDDAVSAASSSCVASAASVSFSLRMVIWRT